MLVALASIVGAQGLDASLGIDPDGSSGPSVGPSIDIALEPAQREAVVTEDQLGAVTFGGTVTVDQPRLVKGTVTLHAVLDTGWPVVLSPQTLEFTGPGEESFQVTVIVPPATSGDEVGELTATGDLKLPGMAPVRAQATARVTVASYHLVEINATTPKVGLRQGGEATLTGTIENRGNVETTFELSIVDRPSGFECKIQQKRFTVGEGETADFEIRARADNDVDTTIHNLVVSVGCVDGGNVSGESFVFLLDVEPSITSTGSLVSIVVAVVVAVAVILLLKRRGLLRLPRRRTGDEGPQDMDAQDG